MKKEEAGIGMEKVNSSICMATYNGERFLREQVESILSQMQEGDELVIVDDASTDGTLSYLKSIADRRIRVYCNSFNIGHVQSFSKVIGLARGTYILIVDQDDIWIDGRLKTIREALSTGPALVSTNSEFIDRDGRRISPLHPDLVEADSERYNTNIFRIFTGKAYYDGCAMGMRKELLRLVLPIPHYVESHDLWIAMAGNAARSNRHLAQYTLRRRIHGNNASIISRPLLHKLMSRVIFLFSLLHISFRLITRY
jgi:glycosyltransferase involved in cell wall biosynthesis